MKTTPLPAGKFRFPVPHIVAPALVAAALLWSAAHAAAQRSHARITSVRTEPTSIVVSAHVPPGAQEAVLESRPNLGPGSWEIRASIPVFRAGTNVIFTLPRSQPAEFLRLRLAGLTNSPPRIVVFGDSLSDTGLHFELYQTPFTPPNFEGRYSDGPVWIEYLARMLGLDAHEWVNYSVGGAASGRENSGDHPDAPGLFDELDDFEREFPDPGAVDPNALYVLWIGANDFALWNKTEAYKNVPPDVLIGGLLDNVRAAIERLAQRGVKRLLVLNLPDLGEIPLIRNSGNPLAAVGASLGTLGFNLNLAFLLGEIETDPRYSLNIIHADIASLFDRALSHPEEFGLTDTATACWPGGTNAPCELPSTHLFWDDRHPTTLIHSNIARFVLGALSIDPPLPTPCKPPPGNPPTLAISTRNGTFTNASAISISGLVHGAVPAGANLSVNGERAVLGDDGSFSVTVPLAANEMMNSIVAQLSERGAVLAKDRIVVYRGPSVTMGQTVTNALLATASTHGLDALGEFLIQKLTAAGDLNLYARLPDPPLLFFSIPGCNGAVDIWFTGAGYSCVTVNVVPLSDRIQVWFGLNDVFINYGSHGWLIGCPDPGPNCFGSVYSPGIQVHMDFRVQPRRGGRTGDVVVTPLSELILEPFFLQHSVFDCNHDFNIGDDILRLFNPEIEKVVREAIVDRITMPNNDNLLATSLEEAIDQLSVSGKIGGWLGATLTGDIQEIDSRPGQLETKFQAALTGSNAWATESYFVPTGPLRHQSPESVGDSGYDLAASVSLASLNQLILAESGRFPRQWETPELNLGSLTLPLTAKSLSLFLPGLAAEPPDATYKIVLRPALPPMVLGGLAGGGGVAAALDDFQVEIIRTSGGSPSRVLSAALDLRANLVFSYDPVQSTLNFGLDFSPATSGELILKENQVCADERVLNRLLRTGIRPLLRNVESLVYHYRLPKPDNITITPVRLVAEQGYLSAYVNLKPDHGRPDLIITDVEADPAVDVLFTFPVKVCVRNVGFGTARGGVALGGLFSRDSREWNGNDIGLGVKFFNFKDGALRPGESECFTYIASPAPFAFEGDQKLLVRVDVPYTPGGFGAFCEVNEINNLFKTDIRTTRADAFIESIDVPEGLVGGGLAGAYRVRVGRSDVGINVMDVPVRVAVGNPVVTWNDIIVKVPRGDVVTATVVVPTPGSFGPICQQAFNLFEVTACANLAVDSNPGNNCRKTTVPIAVPYFDLRYEVNGPSEARIGQTVNWTVTVRNQGNALSPPVCSRTAIALDRGDNYTRTVNDGLRLFQAPPLLPGNAVTLPFSAVIPFGAAPQQYLKAGIDTFNNCFDVCLAGNNDDEPINICGADLNIVDIDRPDDVVGGVGPRTYTITVRNDGCDTARFVWVRTCLGGACADVGPLTIDPQETRRVSVNLPTPPSFGLPNQANFFPVTACLNGWVDASPVNNCRTEQVRIAVPFWDLRVEVRNSPSSAVVNPCFQSPRAVSWTVTVTNIGNVSSPLFNQSPCLLQTAIVPNSGFGNWAFPLDGMRYFVIPSLLPGRGASFSVGNYKILCGAPWNMTQYVKAEIFCDNLTAGRNWDQNSIFLRAP